MRLRIPFAVMILSALLCMTGCLLDEPVTVDESADVEAEELGDETEGELDVERLDPSVAPGAEQAAGEVTCFTCDLDPTIQSCSSNADRAFYTCRRACVVCQFGDCFLGSCS